MGMSILLNLSLLLLFYMIQSTQAFVSNHNPLNVISNHVDPRSKARFSFEKKIGNKLYHLKGTSSGTGEDIDWDWEKVQESVFAGEDDRPVILFDGVCNLCHGGVNFALDHDEVGTCWHIEFCTF